MRLVLLYTAESMRQGKGAARKCKSGSPPITGTFAWDCTFCTAETRRASPLGADRFWQAEEAIGVVRSTDGLEIACIAAM